MTVKSSIGLHLYDRKDTTLSKVVVPSKGVLLNSLESQLLMVSNPCQVELNHVGETTIRGHLSESTWVLSMICPYFHFFH